MSEIIVNKSKMKCSLGSQTPSINVTSQTFSKIDSELVATEEDYAGMENIPSFGNCRRVWYNPSCTPAPQKWTEVANQNSVDGKKKLLSRSFCLCNHGGKIEFVDTGNNTFTTGE